MRVSWLVGVAALMFPAAAQAQNCGGPADLFERVCNDPELKKLDIQLSAKTSEVAKASPRRTTWETRGLEFRNALADERDMDGKPLGRTELIERYNSQIEEVESELARARTIGAPKTEAEALGAKCLATWLSMNCQVPASGILRGPGIRILWQLQTGASEEDGGGMGVMLWDASKPGVPKLIGWTFEGVYMQAPRYDEEKRLLWVPGTMAGTGGGNADILFQRTQYGWVEIELVSWRRQLEKRLPKGLGAWQGVAYDFGGLGAETDLWRDADANCCPTGGRATIGFKIEHNGAKIDSMQVQQGGPGSKWEDR